MRSSHPPTRECHNRNPAPAPAPPPLELQRHVSAAHVQPPPPPPQIRRAPTFGPLPPLDFPPHPPTSCCIGYLKHVSNHNTSNNIFHRNSIRKALRGRQPLVDKNTSNEVMKEPTCAKASKQTNNNAPEFEGIVEHETQSTPCFELVPGFDPFQTKREAKSLPYHDCLRRKDDEPTLSLCVVSDAREKMMMVRCAVISKYKSSGINLPRTVLKVSLCGQGMGKQTKMTLTQLATVTPIAFSFI
jgi:hypothetical protein